MQPVVLINPNTNTATTQLMISVARKHLPGVPVVGVTVRDGPPLIVNETQLDHAARQVEALAGEVAAMEPSDVIVSAFGDLGADDLAARLSCPVTGIAAASFAASRRSAVLRSSPRHRISRRESSDGHPTLDMRPLLRNVPDRFSGCRFTDDRYGSAQCRTCPRDPGRSQCRGSGGLHRRGAAFRRPATHRRAFMASADRTGPRGCGIDRSLARKLTSPANRAHTQADGLGRSLRSDGFGDFSGKEWSEWQDLNLRPPRPERGALPGCATLRHVSEWGEINDLR